MSFDTPKGKMTFRKEDHQALQAMYHWRMKARPAGQHGPARTGPRDPGRRDEAADPEQAVSDRASATADPARVREHGRGAFASVGSTPMLETDGLTIRFGGHAAVDGVSCAFKPGTLTSIVGPNGAGKTTYFNLISGQLPASAGRVRLNGQDITGLAAPRRTRLGLGRAFQLTNLFPNLSALENVRLAVQVKSGKALDLLSRACDAIASSSTARWSISRPCRWPTAAQSRRGDPAAWRPAQARGRDPAGAGARHLHVRRADRGHERRRGADRAGPSSPRSRSAATRPSCWSSTRWTWCARSSDRIVVLHQGRLVADGEPAEVISSDIVREAYLGGAAEAAQMGPRVRARA